MRFVLIAMALLAFAGAAMAQNKSRGIGNSGPLQEDTKPTFDEKKYKSAIGSVPDAEQNKDPWAGAREPTPAAAPDATTKKTQKR